MKNLQLTNDELANILRASESGRQVFIRAFRTLEGQEKGTPSFQEQAENLVLRTWVRTYNRVACITELRNFAASVPIQSANFDFSLPGAKEFVNQVINYQMVSKLLK